MGMCINPVLQPCINRRRSHKPSLQTSQESYNIKTLSESQAQRLGRRTCLRAGMLAALVKVKAEFIGINIRDEKEAAQAFECIFGISYPSVQDTQGEIRLAMTQYVPLQAVPTTLVLDKQGRVASRVLGAAEKATLKALIDTSLQESL